jgi:hypothetical protein
MLAVNWNRLLQTCYSNGATMTMLVPGSPPLLWTGDLWQSAKTDPITPRNLKEIARQAFANKPDGMADGYFYRDFRFEEALFRLMAFGRPKPSLLVITRFPYQMLPINPRITGGAIE